MMASVDIAGRRVGPGERVLLIAEAGVNHNGEVELAERLVNAAADAGADAVKFQTFSAERVAAADAPKAGYQLETTDAQESQLDMLRRLELPREGLERVIARCAERELMFLSTPFDEPSADLLAELGVPAFKIGSGELTNWPLLERVASKGRPVILSTGMASLDEVVAAAERVRAAGAPGVIVLHCVSNYPAEPRDANLRAIPTLAEATGAPVGWSDHTIGGETALAAVALGAAVVEKHLTLDKTLPGPDHAASLEPNDFAALAAGIRTVESALGDGEKVPVAGELENRKLVRRSVVAARDLPAGTVLEPDVLTALRPATGISPADRDALIGRRTKRDLRRHEQVAWEDVE